MFIKLLWFQVALSIYSVDVWMVMQQVFFFFFLWELPCKGVSVVLTLTLDVPFNHLYVIYFMLITSFNFPKIPQPTPAPPHSIKCFLYLFSWCFRKLVLPKGHLPMELPGVGAIHSVMLCVSQILQISIELYAFWESFPIFPVYYNLLIYYNFGYSLMPIKALASCLQLSPQIWDLLF